MLMIKLSSIQYHLSSMKQISALVSVKVYLILTDGAVSNAKMVAKTLLLREKNIWKAGDIS